MIGKSLISSTTIISLTHIDNYLTGHPNYQDGKFVRKDLRYTLSRIISTRETVYRAECRCQPARGCNQDTAVTRWRVVTAGDAPGLAGDQWGQVGAGLPTLQLIYVQQTRVAGDGTGEGQRKFTAETWQGEHGNWYTWHSTTEGKWGAHKKNEER